MAIANERRVTNGGGLLAATRRAGAIFAGSAVVPKARAALAGLPRGRLFGVTKWRLLRLAGRNNNCQQVLCNECEQALGGSHE